MLPLVNGPQSTTAHENAFAASSAWIQALLTGSIAAAIAVVAIASIGLLMLSGRVDLRRGGRVILGCFVVFGAAILAKGFLGAAEVKSQTRSTDRVFTAAAPLSQPTSVSQPRISDPYAGAALRR
jgi:type IV secretory pathway VirB2 component (pilin)